MATISEDARDTIKLLWELQAINDEAAKLLEQLFSHRVDSNLVKTLLLGKEVAIANLLYKVVTSTHTPHLLGYSLRFFADLVHACPAIGHELGSLSAESRLGSHPPSFFLGLVQTYENKSGISSPALFLAASTLRFGVYTAASAEESKAKLRNEEALKRLMAYVKEKLSTKVLRVTEIEFSVNACLVIARRKVLRPFIVEEGIVGAVPRLLTEVNSPDAASIVQFIYEVIMLVWLLSFEYDGIVALARINIVPLLHRTLQRIQKEKCVRVALMTLQNLLNAQHKYIARTVNHTNDWVDERIYLLGQISEKGPCFISEMVGMGMLKTLYQLSRRKFGDEDIAVILESLCDELERSMESLTSYSEYRGEVLSGSLEWTPVHTSTKFWKENASKLEENSFEVLEKLGQILINSTNDLTLAVACYDLGEVVHHHLTGRSLLLLPQMKGVKERVLALMSHENPDVAKHALLAVQKIMVQRWEFIK